MSQRPAEATTIHTRLMKCALEIDDARAYWSNAAQGAEATPQRAFEAYWFGARSLARVEDLLANMRLRFDAFPTALATLRRWPHMSTDTRRVVCHWHLQLADPLYRRFSSAFLNGRRDAGLPTVTRNIVVDWVRDEGYARWTHATRVQLASKLLSAAHSAGLVSTTRDPRPLATPRVPDDALEYILYLLRETTFEGSVLDNPYLSSVGLTGPDLDARLRALRGVGFARQGALVDLAWRHADLTAWAAATLEPAA